MNFFEDNIYLIRAMSAALLLAPLCSLLGVFVTARRMAFFSDTIAHAALAGVAIGFLVGFNEPTFPMVMFSLLVAVAMFWLKDNTALLTDSIMAILLSGSVALGVIIMSAMKGFRGQLHAYLFGDIQAVSESELVLAAVLSLGVGAVVFGHLNSLTLLSAHEDLAHVSGAPVKLLNYLFVGILTLTVSASIRLLGVLLVTALIVIPPAAARNLSCSLRQQIVGSILCGLASGLGGVWAAYHLDLPAGPSIVLSAISVFLITLAISRFRPTPTAVAMRRKT
ncbi:MAG: metal ABC transporter permease [Verrucomicrobia bacterium]|nr:metal ABC transporter permease [Verrucomicrobiota bacterium]